MTTTTNGGHDNDDDDDDERNASMALFPTKKAALPFGAQIQAWCRPPPLPLPSPQTDEPTTTTSTSTTSGTNQNGHGGGDDANLWLVLQWKLVTNPRQEALEWATTTTTANKNNAGSNGSSRSINSSIYLQSRHEAHAATVSVTTTRGVQTKAKEKKNKNNKNKGNETEQPPCRSVRDESCHQVLGGDNEEEQEDDENGREIINNPHSSLNVSNPKTYRVFAEWIVANLLRLDGTDRVLDVAGGKGKLSLELSSLAGIPCTVLDPVQRKPWSSGTRKRLAKQGKPFPEFVTGYFAVDQNHVHHGNNKNNFLNSHIHQDNEQEDHWQQHVQRTHALIQEHTCLVGLHADQCTEDIVTAALQQLSLSSSSSTSSAVSVAIVPCCVFPDLFATRRLRTSGRLVRSYSDFIQYLLEKEAEAEPPEPPPPQQQQQQQRPLLQSTTLDFVGKNICIYYKAPTPPSPHQAVVPTP
ncbi:hypothetical protein ACA910_002010 [Epithemia clementina (nom. ined.)]